MTDFNQLLESRARENLTTPTSIRLTHDQLNYLNKLSAQSGLSVSKVIQTMIDAQRGGENA